MSAVNPILTSIRSLADQATWDAPIALADASLPGFIRQLGGKGVSHVYFVGCGTSFYAGQVGRYFVEQLAHLPAQAVQAYEFAAHAEPAILGPDTLVVAVSQSGDTEAAVAALDLARSSGARTLAVTAIAGSAVTRVSDATVLTGGEGDTPPAKTSSYVQSLVALWMLAHHLAEQRREPGTARGADRGVERRREVQLAATAARDYLAAAEAPIFALAHQYASAAAVFAVGSGPNVGTAQEGALKVVEMSKLFADARELEDFAHGRFRVVDGSTLFLIVAPQGKASGKALDFLSATAHVKAPTIVFTDEASPGVRGLATHVVQLPRGLSELASPLLTIIPLYLFAYQLAFERGWDPMSRRYENFYPQKMRYAGA